MTVFISIILIALAVLFVWRVFKFASKFQPVEEPPDEVGDVDVREPVPRRPLNRSGAVAMEEPDEDIDTDAYSRK
jgi:hypothetical protein